VLYRGEAVQPREHDRLDAEEAAGQNPGRLGLKELSPGRTAAPGRWIEAGPLRDRPHGGWRHLPTKAGDLPGDAPISPARVFGGQAQHQNTRISASLDACDRASNAIQPNTRKTIKYNSRRAILRSCRSRAIEHSKTPDQRL
jgi:hypothetical protein